MKAISLFFAAFLISSISLAQSKKLSCELEDQARRRILQRHTMPINPSSSRPIVMMLGTSHVVGTVRDFPGNPVRRLELKLDYNAGSTGGHSRSSSTYKLDQPSPSVLLSEVGLVAEFQDLVLRCYLKTTNTNNVALVGDVDLLRTVATETGRGTANGFCDGARGSYFCTDRLKSRAEDQATRDAELTCRVRGGQSLYGRASCSGYCSPFNVPPNSPPQMFHCHATCMISCEVP